MRGFAFRKLPVDKIYVPEKRLRVLDAAKVQMLADSMQRGIQQQPILVHEEERDVRYRLIAGEHRFEAAKGLWWPEIECKVVYEQTEEQLEIYEIEENLIRGELSAIERDISLSRRKKLYEDLYPETKTGKWDRKNKDRQNVDLIRFTKEAARKMGLNERTIQRSAARIKALCPEIIEALKTSPIGDNASEIERLSKLPLEEQIKIAGAISRGAKTLLNARKAVGLAPALPDPTDAAYAKIEAAWARAPKAAREKFLDAILPTWRKLKITIEEPAPKAVPASDDASETGDEE